MLLSSAVSAGGTFFTHLLCTFVCLKVLVSGKVCIMFWNLVNYWILFFPRWRSILCLGWLFSIFVSFVFPSFPLVSWQLNHGISSGLVKLQSFYFMLKMWLHLKNKVCSLPSIGPYQAKFCHLDCGSIKLHRSCPLPSLVYITLRSWCLSHNKKAVKSKFELFLLYGPFWYCCGSSTSYAWQ